MKDYRRATRRIEVSIGDSVRVLRELQDLSQNDLAQLTGIPQSTISAIERDRVNVGVERAHNVRASVGPSVFVVALLLVVTIFGAVAMVLERT